MSRAKRERSMIIDVLSTQMVGFTPCLCLVFVSVYVIAEFSQIVPTPFQSVDSKATVVGTFSRSVYQILL